MFNCVCALAAVTACQPSIVGGPCTYETTILEGIVTESRADGVLISASGEEIYVPLEYIREPLEVDVEVTLKHQRITEGTCTPEIYSVQKRVP